MRKKFCILIILVCCTAVLFAQKGDFTSEVGWHIGAAGQLAPQTSSNIGLNYGLDYRYKFDNRFAVKTEMMQANLYNKLNNKEIHNLITGFNVCGEFNFFDFDDNPYNRLARRVTPYIFAGVGVVGFKFNNSVKIEPSIPFGIGVKIYLQSRLNLNLQYAHWLTFVDTLEGNVALSDTQYIKGSNFMNKDMLSVLSVGLTFDFGKRAKNCHYCPD